MIFDWLPTGWSVPTALAIPSIVGWQASKITMPIVPVLTFVFFGLLPAFAVLMAAWKCSRKKARPFLDFGFGPAEYDAEARIIRRRESPAPETHHADRTPIRDTRPRRRDTTPAAKPVTPAKPVAEVKPAASGWNLELLKELEWRRFELLVEGLFNRQGDWRAEGCAAGADGGVDIFLYPHSGFKPRAAIQCKSYRSKQVGVSVIRELYGVMAAEGIPHGMVVTCGDFSIDAKAFAADKPIDLIGGAQLLELLGDIPADESTSLLREITVGDYETPTCPKCRVKLVRRKSERGEFWGCANYPKCRHTMNGMV